MKRSFHASPSSSMKNVMNAIVTTPATNVITLRVTSSAAVAPPARRPEPLPFTASWTRSTTWYFVSRKPSGPRPCVRSCDVAGRRVDEVVDLLDERRDEQRPERRR